MANKLISDCKIGKRTIIYNFVNLYGCTIGSDCKVGTFVEIQKNVKIGNKVKIGSHSFICEGVKIGSNVFIGHHVVFTNDKHPRSTNDRGELKDNKDWVMLTTAVNKGASIGSNATILGGIKIGENSVVGAGSVVVDDVPENVIVAGNPARIIRKIF